MTAPDGIFTSYDDDGSGGVESEEQQSEPEVQQEEKQDEPEAQQEEQQGDEPDRVMSMTTYDSDPALTAEASRNKRARAEADSSDD